MAISERRVIYVDAEKFREYPVKHRYRKLIQTLSHMVFEWKIKTGNEVDNLEKLGKLIEDNQDVINDIIRVTKLDKVLE